MKLRHCGEFAKEPEAGAREDSSLKRGASKLSRALALLVARLLYLRKNLVFAKAILTITNAGVT